MCVCFISNTAITKHTRLRTYKLKQGRGWGGCGGWGESAKEFQLIPVTSVVGGGCRTDLSADDSFRLPEKDPRKRSETRKEDWTTDPTSRRRPAFRIESFPVSNWSRGVVRGRGGRVKVG